MTALPRISPETQAWLQWMLTTSIPLRRLDSSDAPVSFASSCMVDYRGRRFLLAVEHAVKMNSAGRVIQLGYKPRIGFEVFRLRGFNYVGEMTLGASAIRKIDFCYTEVPSDLDPLYQHVTPRGIADERPRHIFRTDLAASPSLDGIYAFAGEVKTELHGSDMYVSEMNVYPGLRFSRTEGPFHVFALPVAHPGHDQFSGCSGAPIVDTNKTAVALVCDGDIESNTIRGIALSRYRFALDFICEGHHLRLGEAPA